MTKVENSTTKPVLPVAPAMPEKDNSDAAKGALSGFSSGVLSTILAGLNSADAVSSGSGDSGNIGNDTSLLSLIAQLEMEIADGANDDTDTKALVQKIEALLKADGSKLDPTLVAIANRITALIAAAPNPADRRYDVMNVWYNEIAPELETWFQNNADALEALIASMPTDPSKAFSSDQIKLLGGLLVLFFSLLGTGDGIDKKIFGSVFGLMSPSILKDILVAYSYAMAGGNAQEAFNYFKQIVFSLPGFNNPNGITGCPNYDRFLKSLQNGFNFPSMPPSGSDLYFALEQLRSVLSNFFGSL